MVAAVTGCSKKKFEINANPNDVTDVSVTPSVLLPGALQATSTIIASEYWFIGWWMGHGARSVHTSLLMKKRLINLPMIFIMVFGSVFMPMQTIIIS
jgi:hypothetical protein